MVVAAAPSVLDFVEGAPWWVKTIVGVLALLAPYVLAKGPPKRARSEEGPEDDEDLRELRDLLVSYLQRAEKAERELAVAKAAAEDLRTIVDALIARRETPPQGTPRPGP